MTKDLHCTSFSAAGVAAGLKTKGGLDLGLIVSHVPAASAAVFTRNRVQAAPIVVCRERILGGTCRAVVANSGNANCCTGAQGLADARTMTQLVASGLNISPEEVFVASTGVIGAPLAMDNIHASVPDLIAALDPRGFIDFAEAIMTTDTQRKAVAVEDQINGTSFTVLAVAKGAGMIRPDMATMLCFVCTNIKISSMDLQQALDGAVDRSFNRITVDGDTSTNDMVLMMANGTSGAVVESRQDRQRFQNVLDSVLLDLARMMVKDAEGATKLVEVSVQGALCDDDARQVADTVAHSNLVKTAFFGEDANWGRILAAAGRAGVPMNQDRLDIHFNDVLMVKNGVGCGPDAEIQATRVLQQPEFQVVLDLNLGEGQASVLTCDFSIDYVKINADYRS